MSYVKYCGYSYQKPRLKEKREEEEEIKRYMKHTEVLQKKCDPKVVLSMVVLS